MTSSLFTFPQILRIKQTKKTNRKQFCNYQCAGEQRDWKPQPNNVSIVSRTWTTSSIFNILLKHRNIDFIFFKMQTDAQKACLHLLQYPEFSHFALSLVKAEGTKLEKLDSMIHEVA